jgi:ubiquinone/menaquinone biosynthesis C-methylase UbiE
MDISKTYLNYISTHDVSLCLAKLEDAPYEDKFFDAVVCTDVLEHVIDLNQVITHLFRILKNDGLLFIRVPYKENLAQYLTVDYPYQFAHLRNFDDSSLQLLFEKIFNQKIIAVKKGPYIRGGAFQRINFEFKGLAFILRSFFRILHLYDKSLEEKMEHYFYNPVEISLVIQKVK